jgi:hypothetical protein
MFNDPTIIEKIGCIFDRHYHNENEPMPPKREYICFTSQNVPKISLREYLGRFAQYSDCPTEVFVRAVIYMKRIHRRIYQPPKAIPLLKINSYTIHRLVTTAMLVASKMYYTTDNRTNKYPLTNNLAANIGGIPPQEIHELERDFLSRIEYKLVVSPDEFQHNVSRLASASIHQYCLCKQENSCSETASSFVAPPDSGTSKEEATEHPTPLHAQDLLGTIGEEDLPSRGMLTDSSIIEKIGCIFDQLYHKYEPLPPEQERNKFMNPFVPQISLRKYLDRFARHLDCPIEVFVIAVVYLNDIWEISQKIPQLKINAYTIHRLVMTAILTAAKMHHESDADERGPVTNALAAKIGGVSTRELNQLEVEFLYRINFNLFVSPEDFQEAVDAIISPSFHTDCLCKKPTST